LFPKLKEDLRGKHFPFDNDVIAAITEWLNDREDDFYLIGLRKLEKCWQKRIDVFGDYVEK
jgi:hypothetical protein